MAGDRLCSACDRANAATGRVGLQIRFFARGRGGLNLVSGFARQSVLSAPSALTAALMGWVLHLRLTVVSLIDWIPRMICLHRGGFDL